jgi:phospholipase/carboxylesterase
MQIPIEWLPASGPTEQLILLLHGWADEPATLAPLAQALRAEYPQAAVLAPEAPNAADGGRRGRQWYSIEGIAKPMQDEAERLAIWRRRVADVLPLIEEWVRAQQRRLGVGPAATALGGFSQGAVLSLELAARHDGIVGRVLAFGGCHVVMPHAVPKSTTVHLFHGRDDQTFPVRHAEAVLRHYGAQQGDATIDIAEGVGHVLHPALIDCALHRLRHHIPLRTWAAALGALPRQPAPDRSGPTH